MAFGDKGKFRIIVGGVPFRVDGDDEDEAVQKVVDMLEAAPEVFTERARRLGLTDAQGNVSEDDLEALRIQHELGDRGLRGRVRAADAAGGPGNRFLVGAGHTFLDRFRGARQVLASVMGDEETVEMLAELDKEEQALFDQLDKAGFGAEDLGQLAPDLLAFLVPGAAGAQLTRMGASAGVGTGVVPTAITGALLGASQVRDTEAATLSQTGLDALQGGAAAVVLPAAGAIGTGVGRLLKRLPAGGSVRISPRLWARFHGLNRGQTAANVVEDGLTQSREGVSEGMQILGRAALDKVQEVIRSLPTTASRGLKDQAAMGVVRRSLAEATETLSNGRNIFNPGAWERSMSELAGKVGSVFSGTQHTQMLGAANILAREMQKISDDVTVELAEAASAALLAAPARAKPIVDAIARAQAPEVKKALVQQLADVGMLVGNELIRGGTAAAGVQGGEGALSALNEL